MHRVNVLTDEDVISRVQHPGFNYDKGEKHIMTSEVLIKSIRASDPNAAVYYLARMVEGGEDPKFIARRLLIVASEDIGNANPTALVLANNTFQAVERIGWPEFGSFWLNVSSTWQRVPRATHHTRSLAKRSLGFENKVRLRCHCLFAMRQQD